MNVTAFNYCQPHSINGSLYPGQSFHNLGQVLGSSEEIKKVYISVHHVAMISPDSLQIVQYSISPGYNTL